MAFCVKQTRRAKYDLDTLLGKLLDAGAGETGIQWLTELESAIDSLAEMPQRCALAPENDTFPFEVRHLLYGRHPNTYRVLFTISGDIVLILHIRHGRQEPLRRH